MSYSGDLSIPRKHNSVHQNQQGVVAIFSVLVIMGILTLLAMAFSNVTRQAQRRALDDHLSTQAFYAAESGINIASANLTNKNDCGPRAGENFDVDAINNIAVTCLKINVEPESIEYKEVPLESSGGTTGYISVPDASNSLRIRWTNAEGDSSSNNGPSNIIDDQSTDSSPRLYRAGSGSGEWSSNHVGILKVDLVPIDNLPPQNTLGDRNYLVNNSYSFYLYPTRNPSTSSNTSVSPGPNGPNGQGKVSVINCNSGSGGYRCAANVSLSGSHRSFYYRLTSVNSVVRPNIGVENPAITGTFQTISDGQAIIDSTGRANDILRRIQVRVPIGRSAENRINPGAAPIEFPSYALFAENVCKRYVIYSTNGADAVNDTNNPLCQDSPSEP